MSLENGAIENVNELRKFIKSFEGEVFQPASIKVNYDMIVDLLELIKEKEEKNTGKGVGD